MTLYDEAGLSRHATAEEIRHAYHNIVRLLHPDSLQDPELRSVAEAQLRRINAVFEVLNDPKRRAEYDLTLLMGTPGAAPLVRAFPVDRTNNFRTLVKPVVMGLAVVGLINLLWTITKLEDRPPQPEELEEAIETPGPQAYSRPPISARVPDSSDIADEIRKLRRELREVRGVTQPVREADREDHLRPPAPLDIDSIPLTEPALTAPPFRTNAPVIVPPSPAGSPVGVVGTWLYAQRRGDVTRKDWYPPDFIELRVQPLANRAEEGAVAGRFQARYRVGDRLISPEVRFRFEGKGDVFPWSGPNGARGEVRIKQVTPLTLQVDWTTTHPGDVPSLTSGSSLLVKSPE